MNSYLEILKKIQNKESTFLTSIITGEPLFPCTIPVNKKPSGDLTTDDEIYRGIFIHSKNHTGSGYTIKTKQSARTHNTRLSSIIVESEIDFLSILGKKYSSQQRSMDKMVRDFRQAIAQFRSHFASPLIDQYLLENKKSIFKATPLYINNFIEISHYLLQHPALHVYPRNIPTQGDTKFLEKNGAKIIRFISKYREINQNLNKWEQLGLLDPSTVLLRSGKELIHTNAGISLNTSPITLKPNELNFEIYDKKIYIIENLSTFKVFHLEDDELALYAGGFAIVTIENAPLLSHNQLIYFGDLDEHGFAILSKFRALYPKTQSLCMDLPTIQTYQNYLIQGEDYSGAIENLTEKETQAFAFLHAHRIQGVSSRIEQEKISRDYIQSRLREFKETNSSHK